MPRTSRQIASPGSSSFAGELAPERVLVALLARHAVQLGARRVGEAERELGDAVQLEQRAEAEARVVEQIPTTAWIRGVKIYCDL